MPLPRSVKVHGVRYKMRHVNGRKDKTMSGLKCMGCVEFNRDGTGPVISIDNTQTKDKQAETFIHEIIHVIGSELGIAQLLNTEKITNPLARSLYGVLKDNPKIAKWLIED